MPEREQKQLEREARRLLDGEPYDHAALGHVTCVTRGHRWFRRVYYVRCWQCDLHRGPFRSRTFADSLSRELWGKQTERWEAGGR